LGHSGETKNELRENKKSARIDLSWRTTWLGLKWSRIVLNISSGRSRAAMNRRAQGAISGTGVFGILSMFSAGVLIQN
jgi:hypothetical protein